MSIDTWTTRNSPHVGSSFHQPVFEAVFEVGGVLPACIDPTISDCNSLESARKTGFEHGISCEYLNELPVQDNHCGQPTKVWDVLSSIALSSKICL